MGQVKHFLVPFVKIPKTLNRDFRSDLNLLVSRDGETFGFVSLVSDTEKALASLKYI